MMEAQFRHVIQRADKHARNKNHPCLLPGCKNAAIRSHSIPRAACVEALAENGILFTRRQSLNAAMKMTSPSDPIEVVEIGVNDASTFTGYCPSHDNLLFHPAESTIQKEKSAMVLSLHLRALSLEFCRKRQTVDFFRKVAELADSDRKGDLLKIAADSEFELSCFKKVYLDSFFSSMYGHTSDEVDYYCIPFSRNLQVSCCGCFNANPSAFGSVISYNLVSYIGISVLFLTIFNAVKQHMNAFLQRYKIPVDVERLVNDIAFNHCEEPLIAPALWRTLSEAEKRDIQLSLRHPNVRNGSTTPRVVKLSPKDFFSSRDNFAPDSLARLPPEMAQLVSR